MRVAWLAGFWDGEGSIGAGLTRGTWRLLAQLSHTEIDTVRAVLAILADNGIRGCGYTYQERDPAKHRDAHYIRVNGTANILRLAELLLSHSVTKRRHWELAISFALSRIAVAGGINAKGHLLRGGLPADRAYSNADIATVAELCRLNRRGPEDRANRKTCFGRIAA
jgi:hypothetical protein